MQASVFQVIAKPPYFFSVSYLSRVQALPVQVLRTDVIFISPLKKKDWNSLSLHHLLSLNYLVMLHVSQQKSSMGPSQLPHTSNFYYCLKLCSDQSGKSA